MIIILYVDWSDWSTQISTPDYDNLYTSLLNPGVTQTSKVVFSAPKRIGFLLITIDRIARNLDTSQLLTRPGASPPVIHPQVKRKIGQETLNLWITIRPQTRQPIVYPRSLASSTCCRLNAKDCPKRST